MEFKEVTEWMNNVYERKNADYGDSFSKTYAEFGLTSAAVRINDKKEIEDFRETVEWYE